MHINNFFITTILSLCSTALSAPQKRAPEDFTAPTPYHSISKDAGSQTLEKRNIGGVRISDGADFTGHVWYGIMPLADCIALNSYAHNVGSFRPDEGTECFLYQGHCDDEQPYGDLLYTSPFVGSLADHYDFIDNVESFMCFSED